MPTVELDGRRITNWPAFHNESQLCFGFPDIYGRNQDAWIDCLSGLRDDDGMTAFVLGADETLEVVLHHAATLRQRAPRILRALEENIAEINQRYVEDGAKPALVLRLR